MKWVGLFETLQTWLLYSKLWDWAKQGLQTERWESGHWFLLSPLAFTHHFGNPSPWFSCGVMFVLFCLNPWGSRETASNTSPRMASDLSLDKSEQLVTMWLAQGWAYAPPEPIRCHQIPRDGSGYSFLGLEVAPAWGRCCRSLLPPMTREPSYQSGQCRGTEAEIWMGRN